MITDSHPIVPRTENLRRRVNRVGPQTARCKPWDVQYFCDLQYLKEIQVVLVNPVSILSIFKENNSYCYD